MYIIFDYNNISRSGIYILFFFHQHLPYIVLGDVSHVQRTIQMWFPSLIYLQSHEKYKPPAHSAEILMCSFIQQLRITFLLHALSMWWGTQRWRRETRHALWKYADNSQVKKIISRLNSDTDEHYREGLSESWQRKWTGH